MNPVSFCKGRREMRCKRYHRSEIQPFSPASAVPLAASMRRFAPLPLTAHASAYAILAFADGSSRNSSLHPPLEALGISTLTQGRQEMHSNPSAQNLHKEAEKCGSLPRRIERKKAKARVMRSCAFAFFRYIKIWGRKHFLKTAAFL